MKNAKVYGDIEIEKRECVGHVQKWMGGKLQCLKQSMKNKKLKDGKTLGGKGRLTDGLINKLQSYYGNAIQNNLQSLKDMQTSDWAIFYHTLVTDQNPTHDMCPTTPDTWCKYNATWTNHTTYSHAKPILSSVAKTVKSIFQELSSDKLLKKCLHRDTQNQNESLNNVVWTYLPKHVFVGYTVLQIGAYEAVLAYNSGFQSCVDVLQHLDIPPRFDYWRASHCTDEDQISKCQYTDFLLTKCKQKHREHNQDENLNNV
jgi:hypothetical protein